jgi:mono/diheme cytochrome c family protein
MHKIALSTLSFVAVLGFVGWAQSARQTASPPQATYSQQQATRGKALFAAHCASCHTADPAKPVETDYPMRLPIALSGELFLQKWRTVGDLYSKVSKSMPIDTKVGIAGLKDDEYADIVAFLLQVNGRPAGAEVPGDIAKMHAIVLDPRAVASSKPAPAAAPAGIAPSDAYYTEEQARRGKAYFRGACSLCHQAEGETVEGGPPWIGRLNGRGKALNAVVSDRFAERWQNVARIYNKVRTTMPGHDSGGMSTGAYVDITAYILRSNGMPAGQRELTGDLVAMEGMTLLEKGYQRLFNGRDFSGLKFLIGANCTPKPTGCGKTDPAPTFRIENGTIICSGKPYGYMYTDKTYLNFTLRLDYRFPPYPGMRSDDDFYGNSGYLLFINKLQVWPPYIEIQGGHFGMLSVTVTGSPAQFTVDAEARRRALRPVGAWNSVEIVSEKGQVKSSLNGVLVSTVTQHSYPAGYIGFQSEGSEIHWRNLRIKEG